MCKETKEDAPKGCEEQSEKSSTPTPQSTSSKKEATAIPGKDAFGRPACKKDSRECHESHESFQNKLGEGCGSREASESGKEKGEKESSQSCTRVDSEKIGKKSTCGQISQYCQDLVRRKVAVEPPDHLPPAAASYYSHTGRKTLLTKPKLLQLMTRWAPTAGLYVAATALVTVWVTEWDTVVKHIPFYRPEEEVPIGKKIPSMAQDVPADIPSQDDDSGDSTST